MIGRASLSLVNRVNKELAQTIAPDTEPHGESDELHEQERLKQSEAGVRRVQGEDHQGRKSNHRADQHRVLAIVPRSQRDRTACRELAGDAGGEISGDLRPRHCFESADNALVEMLEIDVAELEGLLKKSA